jgi:hypothetical protein
MEEHALQIIDRVFTDPEEVLGTIERNTEIKVALFVLCALGWDVAKDMAFAFQIRRGTIDGAKAAHAADFALRDEQGLCAIGEVKHWQVPDIGWARGLVQVQRYQRALGTPRAFLTCGRRWVILDPSGLVLQDVRMRDAVASAAGLIAALKPFLGKGCIDGQVADTTIWRYGLSPPSVS